MPLNETLNLDISSAQRQIDALNRQLDQLSQPIDVPVSVTGEQSLENVTRDLTRSEGAVEELNRELNQTDEALRGAGTAARRTGDDIEDVGRRGTSAFKGMGASLLAFGAAFGAIQGARAFLDFAGDAIGAASDLEESTSKANVVFGEFIDQIEDFASTAPQALGLSTAAALEFTGTFGNLFVALGLSQQAAAELSPEIVQLGADLASFNNIEVTEALEKLRAGLVGEAEPLRALGVNLTAAATAAKAVELGLAGSTGEVDEAAKVQARYALILEQTQTAQGDFARTADGIANTQRTIAAEFENVRAKVGEALLPAYQSLLDIAPALISIIEDGLVPAFASLGASVGSVDTSGFTRTLAGLPSAVSTAFGQIGDSVGFLGNAFGGLGDLVTFDVVGAFNQFKDAADNISDIQIRGEVNRSIQDLLTTIQQGAAPLSAFEAVLADLGDADLPVDALGDLALKLGQIAGISDADTAGLRELSDSIRANGEAAGFTVPEIEAITTAILQLGNLDPQGFGVAFSEFINGVGEAAVEAGPPIEDFRLTLDRLKQINLEGTFGGLADAFQALPEDLAAAGLAMKTEEGEIVTDFTDFLSNLSESVANQAAFDADIAILEAMGLDNLAALFEETGIDARDLLTDALTNPAEAAEAERVLDQQAADAAVSALDSWRESLTTGFDALGLQFDIPVYPVLQPLDPAAFALGAGESLVNGEFPAGGGGNVFNITYTNPEVPRDDTERNNQVIRAVVGNAR